MAQHTATVVERRTFGPLTQLALHAPDLARGARPGQYVLARCAPPDSDDPLLRRAAFLAGADPAGGGVTLLLGPDERGLAWLAARGPGERLDLAGPFGTPFSVERTARHLLLVGGGPALAALVFLAHDAARRGAAAMLLAAPAGGPIPPPFLLPPDVEYQTADDEGGLLALLAAQPSPIAWADQLAAALGAAHLSGLADRVRAARMRWPRGFAQVALAGPTPCGTGVCLGCQVETREGPRLRCREGPVFDLRDLR